LLKVVEVAAGYADQVTELVNAVGELRVFRFAGFVRLFVLGHCLV